MQLKAGKILVSSSIMDDYIFKNTTLFLTEYNSNGAIAFIINKAAQPPLNALQKFSSGPAFPLYDGGPVDPEHLFFIHRRPDLISGGKPIVEDVFIGGDFAQAVLLINKGILTQADIKIFIGYCGWETGEIEAEIEEGSWLLSNDDYDSFFSDIR